MNWFEHRHYWRIKASHPIGDKDSNFGLLRLEECSCGAVRTIEYRPGEDPVVRTVNT